MDIAKTVSLQARRPTDGVTQSPEGVMLLSAAFIALMINGCRPQKSPVCDHGFSGICYMRWNKNVHRINETARYASGTGYIFQLSTEIYTDP